MWHIQPPKPRHIPLTSSLAFCKGVGSLPLTITFEKVDYLGSRCQSRKVHYNPLPWLSTIFMFTILKWTFKCLHLSIAAYPRKKTKLSGSGIVTTWEFLGNVCSYSIMPYWFCSLYVNILSTQQRDKRKGKIYISTHMYTHMFIHHSEKQRKHLSLFLQLVTRPWVLSSSPLERVAIIQYVENANVNQK